MKSITNHRTGVWAVLFWVLWLGMGLGLSMNATTVQARDNDGDGYSPPADCNDDDRRFHPLAPELCSLEVDENCDGYITVCAEETPGNPKSVVAEAVSDNEVVIGWQTGTGTKDHILSYKEGLEVPVNCTQDGKILKEGDIQGNRIKISDLKEKTHYSFRLCSVVQKRISEGVTFSKRTKSKLPHEIKNLKVTSATDKEITLEWEGKEDSVFGYRVIYLSGNNAPKSCIDRGISEEMMGSEKKYLTIKNLSHQSQYSFRVCAFNDNEKREYTSGLDITGRTEFALPPMPTNFIVEKNWHKKLELRWVSGGGSSVGFQITYKKGGAHPVDCFDGSTLDAKAIGNYKADVDGLSPGEVYSFAICAFNGNKQVQYSKPIFVSGRTLEMVPPDPVAVEGVALSPKSVELKWESAKGTTNDFIIAFGVGEKAVPNCRTGSIISAERIKNNRRIVIDNLGDDGQYAFRICARNRNPVPDLSPGALVLVKTKEHIPPEVASLKLDPLDHEKVKVSWTSGLGATKKFLISYGKKSGMMPACKGGDIIEKDGKQNQVIIEGLSSNSPYWVMLCAVNGNSLPDVSKGKFAMTQTQLAPPPNPVNFSGDAKSDTEILLSWNSAGGTTLGQKLVYSKGEKAPGNCREGTTYVLPKVQKNKKQVAVLKDLSPETVYSFRLCSYNGNVIPSISEGVTIEVKTLFGMAPLPLNLKSEVKSDRKVVLKWTSQKGSTKGFLVLLGKGNKDPGNCVFRDFSQKNYTSDEEFEVDGLRPETQYSAKICSLNQNLPPLVSQGPVITFTTWKDTPPNASVFRAQSMGANAVQVSWKPSEGSTKGYRIVYEKGGDAPSSCEDGQKLELNLSSQKATGAVFKNLEPDTRYSFRICSVNDNPVPYYSGGVTVSAKTLGLRPPEPTSLHLEKFPDGRTKFSWVKPEDSISGFRVSISSKGTPAAYCNKQVVFPESKVEGTSVIIPAFKKKGTYWLRVCSVKGGGNDGASLSEGATSKIVVER